MIKTFDMRFIRYANIFERETRIRVSHCFLYNNTIMFVVPKEFVMAAIGRDNSNLQKLSRIIQKRVKVVAKPVNADTESIKRFVSTIVSPVEFEKLEVLEGEKGKEIVITAGGMESKARLIGRNRERLNELGNIIEQYFEIKNVRIV